VNVKTSEAGCPGQTDTAADSQPAACPQVSAADGHVMRSLHDPAGARCHTLASAMQVGEVLYMGSLGTSHVCALELGQGAVAAAAA
jgi:hypothetical protein